LLKTTTTTKPKLFSRRPSLHGGKRLEGLEYSYFAASIAGHVLRNISGIVTRVLFLFFFLFIFLSPYFSSLFLAEPALLLVSAHQRRADISPCLTKTTIFASIDS